MYIDSHGTTSLFMEQTSRPFQRHIIHVVLPWGGVTPNSRLVLRICHSTIYDEQRSLELYLSEIDSFAIWCNDNYLDPYVKKTKEMIFDFRSKLTPHVPTVINNSEVEVVGTYKYLGTVIDDKLKGLYNFN